MKVAFGVQQDKGLDSIIDSRFGRAPGFVIVDTDTNQTEYVQNTQNYQAAQGAGIQSAQNVLDKNVQALVTRNCGPKAFRVLSQAGISIYLSQDNTIKEALEKLKNKELSPISNSNVEGHW